MTQEELNAVLPSEEISSDQIEDMNAMLSEMGINVVDSEDAEEAEKDTIHMDPSFIAAHSYLGQVYLEKRQYAEAIDKFRTALSLSPGDVAGQADLAYAYAISGKKAQADEILQELQNARGSKYVSTYDWAVIYAGFRDKGKTLEALEEAHQERNGRMVNLRVHPQFAFLNSEPRFQKLLKQIASSLSERQTKEGSESAGPHPGDQSRINEALTDFEGLR